MEELVLNDGELEKVVGGKSRREWVNDMYGIMDGRMSKAEKQSALNDIKEQFTNDATLSRQDREGLMLTYRTLTKILWEYEE